MDARIMQIRPRGINRDLSESNFSPEYAYDIRNLRLNPTDDNTFMSWVTEKGPRLVSLYKTISNNGSIIYTSEETTIEGTPIGYATIEDKVVVFTTETIEEEQIDRIYIIEKINNALYLWEVFKGDSESNGTLNFSTEHPIETLSIYETENAIKVYWVDGINQPRVINLANYLKNQGHYSNDVTQFDFVNTLDFSADITVERKELSSGVFTPGVIQYAFTYYNKFGAETNIFHITPLNYISFNNRGASPEDILGNSFTITISNPEDTKFDYLRIYSIHRTTLDATPAVKRLVDLSLDNIPASRKLTFTDTGEYGDTVDPTILLYVGGKEVSVGTMEQKDNTLFLGDINIKSGLLNNRLRNYIPNVDNPNTLEDTIRDIEIEFYIDEDDDTKVTTEGVATNKTYVYKTQLNKPSNSITTFKYGEYYRFGFQAQKKTGEWSEPIFIGDSQSDIQPKIIKDINVSSIVTGVTVNRPCAKATIPISVINYLKDNGYVNIRPLVVFPSITDRAVLCQGVLAPTVFNGLDRETNSPGVQSSWFFRPFPKADNTDDSSTGIDEITYSNNVLGIFLLNAEARDFKKGRTSTITLTHATVDANTNEVISRNDTDYNVTILGTSSFNIDLDTSISGIFALINYSDNNFLDNLQAADDAIIIDSATSRASGIVGYVDPIEFLINYVDKKLIDLRSLSGYDYNNLILNEGYSDASKEYTGIILNTVFVATNNVTRASITFNKESAEIIEGTGVEIQSRHNKSLYTWGKGVEIQSNADITTADSPYVDYNTYKSNKTWLNNYSDTYFVDQSILTFHSPDLEYDTRLGSIDSANGLKFKIVGVIPITGTIGDMNLTTSTQPYTGGVSNGFKRQQVGYLNVSDNGYKGMCTMNNWTDAIFIGNTEYKMGNTKYKGFAYSTTWPIYPWHRNGSLNNQTIGWDLAESKEGGTDKFSVLKNKKMSNLRFSLWTEYTKTFQNKIDINDIKVFNSDEVTNTRISNYNYYGNVDKVIFVNRKVSYAGGLLVTNGYKLYSASGLIAHGTINLLTNEITADPISMKYKSTLHAVADIGNDLSTKFSEVDVRALFGDNGNFGYLLMVDLVNENIQERFGGTSDFAIQNNSWIIGGDVVSITEEDAVNLIWTEGDTYVQRYDCLKTYPFTMEDTNSIVDILSFICETRINIDGRYDKNRGLTDNLLMSPVNFNKVNPVYSQRNNFFNYRVLDNDLFNFEALPYTIAWSKTKTFGEKVDTWTNITLASSIDMDGDLGALTSIEKINDTLLVLQDKGISQLLYNENTPISTQNGVPLEVANSGKVTGKRTLSDSIGCNNKWSICNTESALYFVDGINKGIYKFSQGISNISDSLGMRTWVRRLNLLNKWTPIDFRGIRTIYDSDNREVYFITNEEALAYSELTNLFTSFYSYEGNPYLVPIRGNLYWIAKETSMVLGKPMKLLNKEYHMWEHNTGDYNKYFNIIFPYGITVIANDNPSIDKVFNAVEFRADVLRPSDTKNKELAISTSRNTYPYDMRLPNKLPFNSIRVWNEYQDTGTKSLERLYGRPSSLKEKFRMWRANIPRCIWQTEGGITKQDRIRNPWAYIELFNNNPDIDKTIIHDLIIHYFG